MGRSSATNILKNYHDAFAGLGWQLPPFGQKLLCLGILVLLQGVGFATTILSLIRETAQDRLLIICMTGASTALCVWWLATVTILCRRIFRPDSVCNVCTVPRLQSATYDGAGGFYYDSTVNPQKQEKDADWTWWGVRYAPEISNGGIIKVAFSCKCVLKIANLILNLGRGVLIEMGSEVGASELTWAAAGVSGLLLMDGAVALVLGGERSPCATVGQLAYKWLYGHTVPFEPVHGLVHSLQELTVTAELAPWGVVVPLLHRYIYDIQVTSTWLVPVLTSFIGITYAVGAILKKGCSTAFMFGILVERGFMPKPRPFRQREGYTVKCISYSIWGPLIELKSANVAKV